MTDFVPAHAKGPKGQSRAFLFCDHATNALPAPYGTLGLSAEQIGDHIAFDPGACALTEALSARLNARSVYCNFSRLLIDPNRGLERDDLVLQQSDGVAIPENQNLSWEARERRIDRYYRPYHDFLEGELKAHIVTNEDPFILSIHTFCRALRSHESHRPWQVGVLWKDDAPSAQYILGYLRDQGLNVGDNEPYSAKTYNYTVDRHVGARGLRHVTLEIRQDLIADESHVRQWADFLEAPFRALIGTSG